MRKEAADILEEMIKDYEREITHPIPGNFLTPYEMLRVLYWLKAALSEDAQGTPPASGDSSQAPQSH